MSVVIVFSSSHSRSHGSRPRRPQAAAESRHRPTGRRRSETAVAYLTTNGQRGVRWADCPLTTFGVGQRRLLARYDQIPEMCDRAPGIRTALDVIARTDAPVCSQVILDPESGAGLHGFLRRRNLQSVLSVEAGGLDDHVVRAKARGRSERGAPQERAAGGYS